MSGCYDERGRPVFGRPNPLSLGHVEIYTPTEPGSLKGPVTVHTVSPALQESARRCLEQVVRRG